MEKCTRAHRKFSTWYLIGILRWELAQPPGQSETITVPQLLQPSSGGSLTSPPSLKPHVQSISQMPQQMGQSESDSRSYATLQDCSPSGSSALGNLQARILKWVAIPSSRGIFPTQGLNPRLLHYRRVFYRLSHQEASDHFHHLHCYRSRSRQPQPPLARISAVISQLDPPSLQVCCLISTQHLAWLL